MSNAVRPHRRQPTRLLFLWDSPGKNTGVGCYFLFQCMCACQVALVMSDSVRPRRRQPTRLLHPWDSPGKNAGVGCHFLLQCMQIKSESEVAQLRLTLRIPWTAAYQAPPSMGVSRQEYWSGVPLLGIIRDEKLGPSQFCPGCAILLCMFVAFSVLMYV